MNRYPVEIRVKDQGRTLYLAFETMDISLASEYLRVESPSAEVQGHSRDQKILVSGKSNIRIKNVELVGNYAVRLVFDDGHSSGIYTWDYLWSLKEDEETFWKKYLSEIEKAGLSR